MTRVKHCLVSEQESGQKVFAYLKKKVGRDFPDSGLQRLIRTGQVRINKKRCRPFDRISAGDVIRIPPYFNSESPDSPCFGPLDIIFENHHFLILNKKENLPVHPGTGHKDSLVGRVVSRCPDAPFQPVPVHRLDKNTTGLILFAKSYSWLREIQDIWHSGKMEKIYLAWVKGEWDGKSGPMTDRLLRRDHKVSVDEKGKPALSWVTPVMKNSGMSLLRIRLSTGRTHQIRVQLAERGFPVIGDMKYGTADRGIKRMLLHSKMLSWPGHRFVIAPDWPDEFAVPEDIMQVT